MLQKQKVYSLIPIAILYYSVLLAQEINGSLDGNVTDNNGQPLTGVNIIFSGKSLPQNTGTTTDVEGYFRAVSLPVGNLDIELQYLGFQVKRIKNVVIYLGKTTSLGTIVLKPSPLEGEEVVITADRLYIDPYSTALSSNLNFDQFETLPTDRDFYSMISLLPQANTSYLGDDVNIAGSTGQENAYYIDGLNTTDMYKAIGGTELPYNFVKAVEYKSAGYSAEYGRSTGGIINLITFSGDNDLRINGFGYFTNNTLSADARRGFIDVKTGNFSRYDAGFSIGGPFIENQLWYFGAYNIQFENEELRLVNLGEDTDKKIKHIFAGKITWRPNNRLNLFLSAFGDPTTWDRIGKNDIAPGSPTSLGNRDVILSKRKEGSVNLSLNSNYMLDIVNQNLLISGNLAWHNGRSQSDPATDIGKEEPLFIDYTTGVWSGGYGESFDRRSERTSASISAELFAGKSSVKIGFQYENNVFHEDWRWLSNGPSNAGMILKYSDNLFLALPLDYQAKVRNMVLSYYMQGAFTFHPRFLLNLGLRWDGQYFKGFSTGIEREITDQFQPRLGFVIQPGKIGTQKITASYGRFYEQIPTWILGIMQELYQEAYWYFDDPFQNPDDGVFMPVAEPGNRIWDARLRGEHFDEFTLGYETFLFQNYKLGIRGIYRQTLEVIQNSDDPNTGIVQHLVGNPGNGLLDFFPDPQRDYRALELTLEKTGGEHFNFFASYVFSRNYGNYTGLYSSDYGFDITNGGPAFDYPEQLINATGLLPNDRTHVFKFNGSYRSNFGLTSGLNFIWQSGTPLSELGRLLPRGNFTIVPDRFLSQRGTAGRSPAIWDLNLRLVYHLGQHINLHSNTKIILDVLHIFSQRKAVFYDQVHYYNVDENNNPIVKNPTYLEPILYQQPMIIRLGLEVEI